MGCHGSGAEQRFATFNWVSKRLGPSPYIGGGILIDYSYHLGPRNSVRTCCRKSAMSDSVVLADALILLRRSIISSSMACTAAMKRSIRGSISAVSSSVCSSCSLSWCVLSCGGRHILA